MSIRLLEIIPTLVRGGAEKQFSLLATRLPTPEFQIHVAALTNGGPYRETLEQAGIPVTLIGKKWKIDPFAYLRLKRLIGTIRPDIVHTWIFAANCYGRRAAVAQRVPHIVACERCVDPWKVWHELAIDRRLARHTERIVVNSSGVREFYERQGIPADKFVLIPNGVEPATPAAPLSRDELLKQLKLPPQSRLVGAVGRLWPQKRYKDLIWAAELLRVGRGDTHLLIVGDGPQRALLERYSEQVQVSAYVHFLGERGDTQSLLPHLDCFWLGSGYEGQSNALMEAMSAGVPVIVTDIPGNRDLVLPDQTGMFVAVGDSGELARKTHQLLNDPERAKRMGESARRRMREEFSVEIMVERYARLFRGMV